MITVEDLSKNYNGFTAVDKVSFNIKKGEIVGLLGHNGAGKTTIMKMLTGYLEPCDGTVVIDRLNTHEHRSLIQSKVGYLPENCPLYPEMTIIDYLEYAAQLHGVPNSLQNESVRTALNHTGLTDKASQLISTLSRGYRQRVGVAQAILHTPTVLILDEPTNGLDPSQIRHMRTLIKKLAENATIILSTHILQEVHAVCDRVIIINNGKLSLDSGLKELQNSSRLLITTNASPENVQTLFQDMQSLQSIAHIGGERMRYRYALEFTGTNKLDLEEKDVITSEATALVAKKLIQMDYKLFELHHEKRDLEAVFRDIESIGAKSDKKQEGGLNG